MFRETQLGPISFFFNLFFRQATACLLMAETRGESHCSSNKQGHPDSELNQITQSHQVKKSSSALSSGDSVTKLYQRIETTIYCADAQLKERQKGQNFYLIVNSQHFRLSNKERPNHVSTVDVLGHGNPGTRPRSPLGHQLT